MNTDSRTRLLLVDDEPDALSVLSDILNDQGFTVVCARDGEEAVEIAHGFHPEVMVSDYRLPGIDGVSTIRRVREQVPGVRSVLVSGHISEPVLEEARREQVDLVLEKPLSVPDLLRGLCHPVA